MNKQTFVHFKALMRKNWIVWKRNPTSSFIQLITPALLMLFLVWFRTKFIPVTITGQGIEKLKHPIYTIDYKNGELSTLKTS